ncbi:MAG: hypothetical protein JXR88_14170 [Clostridia bacterium]|nr:hypothetical protein [Clostridia bacterium]
MFLDLVIGVYGGLNLTAAMLQGKYKNITKKSALVLGIGGLLMVISVFLEGYLSIGILTAGLLLAHLSAILNGIYLYGKINKTHHFARFLISVLIIAGQVMAVLE